MNKLMTQKMLTVNGGKSPTLKNKTYYFPIISEDLGTQELYLKKIKDGHFIKFSTKSLAQMVGVKENILVEMIEKAREERNARYNNVLDPSSVGSGAPISDSDDTLCTDTKMGPEEEIAEGCEKEQQGELYKNDDEVDNAISNRVEL